MRRSIYRGRVVDLGLEDVALPGGGTTTLEVVRHAGAAGVVALDEAERVVLIRQHRHAVGDDLWEIPAGVRDGDEAPAACAERELAEEVGLRAGRWRPLGEMLPTPGYSDERIHLFLAEDLSETAAARDEDEVIHAVERVPLAEALAMIARGEITDGKTALGLYRAAAARAERP